MLHSTRLLRRRHKKRSMAPSTNSKSKFWSAWSRKRKVFKEAQDKLKTYYAELVKTYAQWAAGGGLGVPYSYMSHAVQAIVWASQDILCAHQNRCDKCKKYQVKKKCEQQVQISRKTILKEALDEETKREKDGAK